jgi:hypothetical protein
MSTITTLTGLTLEQLAQALDAELPADAYSATPGGADLTDIDPNYMRSVLNHVFGLCGYGWGYDYDAGDLEMHKEMRETRNGPREVTVATLKRLRFWYKLVADGKEFICEIPSSGASENSTSGYAMSGAVTNAIGKAVSNVGFQESVYLGKRSHKTVARAAKPVQQPTSPAAAKPAPQPAARIEDIEDLDADPANPADFIIGVGKRQGQKLGDQPLEIIQWYAEQMVAGNDPAKKALQTAAQAYLKVRANGKQPVAA